MNVLSVWGTGPGAGKSILTFGLSRLLANRGLRVRVLKPVAVTSGAIAFNGDHRRYDNLSVNFATASRSEYRADSVTIALEPVESWIKDDRFDMDFVTDVWVEGEPVGQCRLAELDRLVPNAEDAIVEAAESALREADVLLVEGAGNPVDGTRAAYLANRLLPQRVPGLRALLSVDCSRGNPYPLLEGTVQLLDAALANRITGFVLNSVRGDLHAPGGFAERAGAGGLAELGRVPRYGGQGEPEPFTPPGYLSGDTALLRLDSWFEDIVVKLEGHLDVEAILRRLALTVP